MALVEIGEEPVWVYPGEVIFSVVEEDPFPVHVMICVEEQETDINQGDPLRVCGIPGRRGDRHLGVVILNDVASAGGFKPSFVGQRWDQPVDALREIAYEATLTAADHSQYGRRFGWGWKMVRAVDEVAAIVPEVHGERPIFTRGTCAQFVEYLYRRRSLAILAAETRDPAGATDIYPTAQMHAFYRGQYPLRVEPWDPRLADLGQCRFGPPDPAPPRSR